MGSFTSHTTSETPEPPRIPVWPLDEDSTTTETTGQASDPPRITLTSERANALFNYIIDIDSLNSDERRRGLIDKLRGFEHISVAGAFDTDLMEQAQDILLSFPSDETSAPLKNLKSMAISSDVMLDTNQPRQFNLFPKLQATDGSFTRCIRVSGEYLGRDKEYEKISDIFRMVGPGRLHVHVDGTQFLPLLGVIEREKPHINRLFCISTSNSHDLIGVESAIIELGSLSGETEVVNPKSFMDGYDVELYWPPSSQSQAAQSGETPSRQVTVRAPRDREPVPDSVNFTFSDDGSAPECEACLSYEGIKGK